MPDHAAARCRRALSSILALAAWGPGQSAPGGPLDRPLESAPLPNGSPPAMAKIDAQELRAHAVYLASDELAGRFTGTDGQTKAAEYIAAHFERLGLLPLGDKQGRGARGFLQHYPLECLRLVPEKTAITLGTERVAAGFAVVPPKKGSAVEVSGSFVFCGYGAPDEIPKVSFRKRIPVVVLAGREQGPRRGMSGTRTLDRAGMIVDELGRRGARVAVFCLVGERDWLADQMNAGALIPGKPLLRFEHERADWLEPQELAAVYLGRPLSLRLLAHLGIEQDPLGGFRQQGAPPEPAGAVELVVEEDAKFSAVNVVAWREGSHAALAKEAVVFSAHMDHMGTRIDGDPFNGADDNASGTAALLEIAEAIAAADAPKRSVVLLAVSGEELGLWGSRFFVQSSAWKTSAIAANVNIDMIGRATELSDERTIAVTPSPNNSAYSSLVRDAVPFAREIGLSLTSGDEFWRRSDHYNFAQRDIPAVFFCGGEHEDYHRVSDHADKLDFGKMERVARLAFWVGWSAADAPSRPKSLGKQADW